MWQKDTAVVIDINADGVADIAVLGYTDDKAAVGIVSGSPSKSFKTKILDFNREATLSEACAEKLRNLLLKKHQKPLKRRWKYFQKDIVFATIALR